MERTKAMARAAVLAARQRTHVAESELESVKATLLAERAAAAERTVGHEAERRLDMERRQLRLVAQHAPAAPPPPPRTPPPRTPKMRGSPAAASPGTKPSTSKPFSGANTPSHDGVSKRKDAWLAPDGRAQWAALHRPVLSLLPTEPCRRYASQTRPIWTRRHHRTGRTHDHGGLDVESATSGERVSSPSPGQHQQRCAWGAKMRVG